MTRAAAAKTNPASIPACPPPVRTEFIVTDPMIRPATDADGDGLAVLIAGCFAEYEGCLFDRAAEFPELDAIATHFREKGGAVWVAEHDEQIVGSIGCTPTEEAGTVELFKLYVAREMRGR